MKRLLALLSVFLALPSYAADLIVSTGATSIRIPVFVSDSSSSTGDGLAGLTGASPGSLTCYYFREAGGASPTAITLANTQALGTWESGKFKEIDATNMKGWYEFGPPDAAFASGASRVSFQCRGATNMAPMNLRVNLGLPFDVVNARATLAGATSTSAVLAAGESSADDRWNGSKIVILSGTAGGSWGCVTDFVNSTDTATIDAWSGGTPSTDSTYDISVNGCADRIGDNGIRNLSYTDDAINARVIANSTIDEGANAANSQTASEMGDNTIDGPALADTAITKIVDGILDEAKSLHTSPNSIGEAIGSGGSGGGSSGPRVD